MTRLTRGVGAALSAFALILGPTSPPAVASAGSSDWACEWGMYGGNSARTFETTCHSVINLVTAPTLIPAWPPFKTAGTVTASPVVVDGKLFVGDWTGRMYGIDAANGAQLWAPFQTSDAPGAAFGPIVSSAAVADTVVLGTRKRLVVFGSGPRLYALDADTGTPVWVEDFGNPDDVDESSDPTEIESSPVVWNDRIYVGIDTHDRPAAEAFGRSGGLLVVDVVTGDLIWKFDPELGIKTRDMIGTPFDSNEEAKHPRTGCGGVWGSPTLDTSGRNGNGIVYFGTANCQSDDSRAWDTPHAEAITALDATDPTADVLWTFQPNPPNPDPNHADWDFGATPNLFTDASGRKILGAGSKDGNYYALDADASEQSESNEGVLLWSSHASYGEPLRRDFAIGGFIGSPAITHFGYPDAKTYVVGGTAIGPPIGEEGIKGYYHARNAADGTNPWADPITGEITLGGIGGPSYAASATVNGVVFTGALDNLFKAYDAATGLLIWTAPLLGPISSGPAIVGDTVYVGSGTSSSDLCAKDMPGSEVCFLYFDTVLGSTGGVHAFRLPPTLY